MFRFFDKLFDRGDPLIEVAKAGDPNLFAETFRASEIVVLSKPIEQSLDPAAMKQDDFVELMEMAAEAAAAAECVRPFVLQTEDSELLPIFTSDEAAEVFVKAYVQKIDRVIPFLTASLTGLQLLPFLEAPMRVVLNPANSNEYELSDILMRELRRGPA